MGQTENRQHSQTDHAGATPADGFDRRALLRRAAIAGAASWTAPVILTSEVASAGVFTAKCAPGTTTAAFPTFVQTACTNASTTLTITLTFAGPCPCGGAGTWCAQKNSPGAVVSSATATLVFSVTVPISSSIAIAGKVAHRCTDRDSDTQYAVYNWAMTATDNGQACGTANSVSAVTLSNRTLVISAACPSLAAAFVAAPVVASQTAVTRPTG